MRKQKSKGVKESEYMMKCYPWLAGFDEEAKAKLIGSPEITTMHVLKLITLLESNVSSEVTKLRNKPNRATKFLTQLKKRVSVSKVGGYMIASSTEQELFPTYGLLMTHIVDITLVSSQIEKFGAQQVATELYHTLKLMFHGNNEYVLDVILCSTLDEHASSKHKVGFQLFTYVVEDSRFFCDTHSKTMKYCAVSSLLFESCAAGRIFVERNLPTTVDKKFPKFLSKTLALDLSEYKVNKSITMKSIIQAIRPTTVKSISRSRLVIVSKKDIYKTMSQSQHPASDSDAGSTSSTLVNLSLPCTQERPSSSSSYFNNRRIYQEDPMCKILGDLGMLDATGNDELMYSHEEQDDGPDSRQGQDGLASSSPTLGVEQAGAVVKDEPQDNSNNYTEEDDEFDNLDSVSMVNNVSKTKKISLKEYSEAENNHKQIGDFQHENDSDDFDSSENGDNQNGYDTDLVRNGNDEGSEEEEESIKVTAKFTDSTENTQTEKRGEISKDEQSEKNKNTSEDRGVEEDDDSDLEILSIKDAAEEAASLEDDSCSSIRDEAEAESGEDFVPNYEEDSDDDSKTIGPEQNENQGDKKEGGNSADKSVTEKEENHVSPIVEEEANVACSNSSNSNTESMDVEADIHALKPMDTNRNDESFETASNDSSEFVSDNISLTDTSTISPPRRGTRRTVTRATQRKNAMGKEKRSASVDSDAPINKRNRTISSKKANVDDDLERDTELVDSQKKQAKVKGNPDNKKGSSSRGKTTLAPPSPPPTRRCTRSSVAIHTVQEEENDIDSSTPKTGRSTRNARRSISVSPSPARGGARVRGRGRPRK